MGKGIEEEEPANTTDWLPPVSFLMMVMMRMIIVCSLD